MPSASVSAARGLDSVNLSPRSQSTTPFAFRSPSTAPFPFLSSVASRRPSPSMSLGAATSSAMKAVWAMEEPLSDWMV